MKKSVSTLLDTQVASTQSLILNLASIKLASVQIVYSNVAPSAAAVLAAAVDATANTLTKTSHGFVTGLKGQMTTSSALPGGLATTTDYFVVKIDADTFKLASSLANAEAGTVIDITTQGTGTHTFTATTSTGNVCKLQHSNDGTNYKDLGSYTATIATSASSDIWRVGDVSDIGYIKVLYTPSAGQIALKVVAVQTPL